MVMVKVVEAIMMRVVEVMMMEVEMVEVLLTALAAPGRSVLGQKLHHVLDPPQLLLDLDVTLTGRLRLARAHTRTHIYVYMMETSRR